MGSRTTLRRHKLRNYKRQIRFTNSGAITISFGAVGISNNLTYYDYQQQLQQQQFDLELQRAQYGSGNYYK